jgi:hypothetical protein
MKILVAVDGSPFTKRMLAYLAAHDEWLGSHMSTPCSTPCRRCRRAPRRCSTSRC